MSGNEPTETAAPPAKKTAVLVLGCPQVPVQTSVALYLVDRLSHAGITPVIAGNKAAITLLVVADPKRYYLKEVMDLDRAVAQISDKKRDFDLCFVFIHNDAGVSYAATMAAISKATIFPVIYGEHWEEMAAQITFPCTKIAAKAVHNPLPLKKIIDEVTSSWVA